MVRVEQMMACDQIPVHVTGVGVLTPDGEGLGTIRSLLSECTEPANAQYPVVAPDIRLISGLPAERFANRRQIRLMDRAMALSVAAAGLTFEDGLMSPDLIKSCGGDIATVVGSMQGELPALFRFGRPLYEGEESSVNPAHFPMIGSNIACGQVALTFGLRGWSSMISCGEVSGFHALSRAASWIAAGRGDIALVGAYETFSKLTADWIQACLASDEGFSEQDSGIRPAMVESACFFLLESERSMRRRAVKSYGCIGPSISGYQFAGTRMRAIERLDAYIEKVADGGSASSKVFSGRVDSEEVGFEQEMLRRLEARYDNVSEVATRRAFGDSGSVNIFLQAVAAMLDFEDGESANAPVDDLFISVASSRGGYGLMSLRRAEG